MVFAIGLHLLHYCLANGQIWIPVFKGLENQISSQTKEIEGGLPSLLKEAHVGHDKFVELVWLITAMYHDHGRIPILLARLQASNDTMLPGVWVEGCRAFLTYPRRQCFYRLSEGNPPFCTGPSVEELRKAGEDIAKRTGISGFGEILQESLTRLAALGPLYLCESRTRDKATHEKRLKDKSIDHATLSAIELNLLAKELSLDCANAKVLRLAFLAAAGAVVTHHFGVPGDPCEDLLSLLSFKQNPLGVILRIADYAQSWLRPFLLAPKSDTDSDKPKGSYPAGKYHINQQSCSESSGRGKSNKMTAKDVRIEYLWSSPVEKVVFKDTGCDQEEGCPLFGDCKSKRSVHITVHSALSSTLENAFPGKSEGMIRDALREFHNLDKWLKENRCAKREERDFPEGLCFKLVWKTRDKEEENLLRDLCGRADDVAHRR